MRVKSRHQKIYIPNKLKSELVQISFFPLTVVVSPSGFGKTTAVREYFKEFLPDNARLYWYTCFSENSSVDWVGICDLFAGVDSETAKNLKKLGFPTTDSLIHILVYLKNLCCNKKTYIVIDNFHLFKSDIQQDLVNVLSMHGNPHLHIIIITQNSEKKTQSSFHNSNIHTIDSSAFFLDKDSTAKLLKMEGICLNDDELNSVYTSTEGWISALWIQISNYKQTGSFDITSDIDYLVETAIWNRLTPEQKNCLVTLSVMDRFTARQAAILLGEETLPDHIKDFLKYNDFIRYYPRERIYVMHNILQNYSRNQFYQYQPEAFQKRVLRAAGQCCIAEGDFYSAMRFFFKLRDFDALLSTPFDVIYILNRRENNIIEFLKEVINECPEEILCKYPFVMLMLSYVFQIDGEYESYQKLCHLLEFVLNSNPAGLCKDELQQLMGEILLLKSFTIYNDLKKVNEMQKAALKLLGESSRFSLNEVPITLGAKSVLGMFWREPGKLDETLADMQRYLPYHSKLTCGQGTGADCALQAEMMLMRGDYISAETLCYKALYQARSKNEICICLCVELILAQISIMRGDVDGFFTIIKNIKDYARENSKLYILRMIDICLSVISVVLGTTDMVAKWLFDAESIRKNVYYRAVPYVNTIYLYLLIRENRYAELLGMVDNTITMAKEMNYILPQVYCLVLKARVCYASGKESEALESLEEAFALALPDKIYMPFVQFTYMGDILSKAYFGPTTWTCSVTFSILSNYGEVKNPAPLSKGFESILGWKTDIDNIMSLFDRFHKGRIKILNALNRVNSPLTPREREVAILAKSRLSNKEIAEKLYISPATVRTILYNAYNKLGIHSRSQLFKIDF